MRNTKAGVTLTAAQQAYIVGTLNEIKDENDNFLTNGVLFTVDEAVFTNAPDVYTGADPNPLEGKYLIPIGLLYSTYQVYFEGGVPTLYTYKNNKLVRYPSDDIYTVSETTLNQGSRIEQLNDQILLKADSSTVTNNYNFLNGKIESIEATTNQNSADLSVMSTQIAAKVSSSEVSQLIDNATGTIKSDIKRGRRGALRRAVLCTRPRRANLCRLCGGMEKTDGKLQRESGKTQAEHPPAAGLQALSDAAQGRDGAGSVLRVAHHAVRAGAAAAGAADH